MIEKWFVYTETCHPQYIEDGDRSWTSVSCLDLASAVRMADQKVKGFQKAVVDELLVYHRRPQEDRLWAWQHLLAWLPTAQLGDRFEWEDSSWIVASSREPASPPKDTEGHRRRSKREAEEALKHRREMYDRLKAEFENS